MDKKETPQIDQSNEFDEFSEIMKSEGKEIRREKMDLSSTRRVLYHLMKEGEITAEDKLMDVLKVIDEELEKIEEI